MRKCGDHNKNILIYCIYTITLAGVLFNFSSWGCRTAEPLAQKFESETGAAEIIPAESSTLKTAEFENDVPESTEAADEVVFTFTVAGDNRPADDLLPQPAVFIKLLEYMKDAAPVFFINTGDIINGKTGSEETVIRQFKDYLNAVSTLGDLNFVSCGNHDISNSTSRKYFNELINGPVFESAESFGIKINSEKTGDTEDNNGAADNNASNISVKYKNLYYYFKYENVYFVILNAYEEGLWGFIKDRQLSWLEKILDVLKNEDVFIFIHPPVFSYLNPDCITDGSKHVAFSSKKNQDYIRELFKEFKVDAVFSGHDHMFYRETHDGTEYIITGCSGAYPYVTEEEGGFYHFLKIDVKPNSWILTVIDKNGDIFSEDEIPFN